MISKFSDLIDNINILRKKEKKPPLKDEQIEMVKEQVDQRKKYGKFSLFPQKKDE